MQLSYGTIDSPPLRAAGLSIHTGAVHQKHSPDTTSRGGSALEQNFTPRRIWNFHTEEGVENWCRIHACKRQCEWGYSLSSETSLQHPEPQITQTHTTLPDFVVSYLLVGQKSKVTDQPTDKYRNV